MRFKSGLSNAKQSLVVLAALFSFQSVGLAQRADCPCEPTPKIKAALERLLRYDDQRVPKETFYQQQLEQLRALLKAHPDDFFIHRRYQDAVVGFGAQAERSRMIAEYRPRAEQSPQNPVAQYLYARALGVPNREQALAVLQPALAAAPTCPHLHLLGAHLCQFRDQEKGREHLAEFMRLCPNSLEGYAYSALITDPAELQAMATRLRARLRGANDLPSVEAYSRLWSIEFRARPVAEHPQLRLQIRHDLQALRAQNRVSEMQWLATLREGYKYISDEDGRRWVEEQLERRFPHAAWTWSVLDERWRAEHPSPDAQATPEQRQAYYRALVQHLERMCRHLPYHLSGRLQHFYALTQLADSADEAITSAADDLLRVLNQPSDVVYFSLPVHLSIAREYLKREIHLDRIARLIQDGLDHFERQGARFAVSPEMRKMHERDMVYARQESWKLLFETHMKLHQYAKARKVLTEIKAFLQEKSATAEPEVSDTQAERKHRLESSFWEWSGELAEAENRRLDALAFYQRAGRWDKVQPLWLAVGGTDDGWRALMAEKSSPTPKPTPTTLGNWAQRDTVLPDFTLSDVQGKTWKLSELKGKTLFINLWATWCGPCKEELPHVQKLYEQLKTRQDVVLLTFNVDDNLGLIEPFLKKQGYTFPALPAKAYVQQLVPQLSIPRNWIVGTDGVMRLEQVGFGGSGDEWLKRALETIERVQTNQSQ